MAASSHCGGNNIHDDREDEASAPGAADLYAVLGLNRECTDAELRASYRRLAMIWHPDRCSASASSARVEEAKERFQEIQGAYSVLSDSNKRLLYDVGVYDSEDDEADLSGMGDFLGEMADMMNQATPTETFEELQQVFVDMFQDDLDDAGFFGGLLPTTGRRAQAPSTSPSSLRPTPAGRNNMGVQAPSSSSFKGDERRGASTAKRPRPGSVGLEPDLGLSGFCFMVSQSKERQHTAWASDDGDERSGNKQRLSTSRDGWDIALTAKPEHHKPVAVYVTNNLVLKSNQVREFWGIKAQAKARNRRTARWVYLEKQNSGQFCSSLITPYSYYTGLIIWTRTRDRQPNQTQAARHQSLVVAPPPSPSSLLLDEKQCSVAAPSSW